MKHTRITVPLRWLLLLLPVLTLSCDDKLAEYYKEPDWLKGSIYEPSPKSPFPHSITQVFLRCENRIIRLGV